jgi:hypothetical protein
MKKEEFFQLIDEYGVDITKLSIEIGELYGYEGAHGIYEKDGQWIYYSADGRNNIDEDFFKNEEEAFDFIFKKVFVDLSRKRYYTMIIDEKIVKIPKGKVCSYIRDTYSLSEAQAADAWNYLKQDMKVLFEFKHYVATGEFVPEKFSYKVQGYSAEQLYKTTYLEALGAFNYLIYLKKNPKEALANLKAGLLRR